MGSSLVAPPPVSSPRRTLPPPSSIAFSFLRQKKSMRNTLLRDFRLPCEVDEYCALMLYYVAYSDNSSPKFRVNLSVSLKMVPIGCLDTSVRNYRHTLRNIQEQLNLKMLF
jgi:hypothetical protein